MLLEIVIGGTGSVRRGCGGVEVLGKVVVVL